MNLMEKVTKVVAITITIWSALYISRFTDYAGLLIAPAQNQAIFLGLVMALAFLSCPAKKGMRGVKWYDWLLVVASVVPNAYVLFFYDTWQLHGVTAPKTYEIVFGIGLAIALLEGLRRVIGIVLSFLTLGFILHPIFSNYLPGFFSGRGYSVARVFGAIFLCPEGIYSTPLNIASTIVVGFLLFGGLLLISAAGQSLTDLALSAVGRVRGGAAKAACIGSGMFGMLSGSPSANVAVTGTFTIPLMKRTGYSAMFAGGVEAAAANGGGLMPPVMGAVAFVMADMLEIPYIQICYCAFVPAVLYYFGMFMMVDFEAGRLSLRGLLPSQVPTFRKSKKLWWPYFFPVILLIYLMFGQKFSPELSAFWTAVSVVVVSWCRKNTRIYPKKIIAALESTGKNVTQVGLACAMAGIMMGSLSLTGISVLLSSELVVAPALIQMGVPKMAAHLFVLWYAIASYITPPEGMAFFVAAAVARANPMAVGWRATLLGIGNFVIPFVFVYNPALLVEGYSIPQIALAIVTAALGMLALSVGIEGYFLKRIGWVQRILILGCGVLVFVPVWGIRLSGAAIVTVIFGLLGLSRTKEVLTTR
jgi:TRAP transporter 4TM/12TM fusion protein